MQDMFKVVFPGTGRSVSVPAGTTLLAAAQAAGADIYAPCGGSGRCGKCIAVVDGEQVLSCRHIINSDTEAYIPRVTDRFMTGGTAVTFRTDGRSRLAAAFDVGTTSLAGYLMDGSSGQTLAVSARLNPQQSHGADLITRIQYCLSGHPEDLSSPVRDALCSMLTGMCEEAGRGTGEVDTVAIAGNTAMMHLLLEKDPKPLTVPPYMPLSVSAERFTCGDFLPACPSAEVRVLPCIAGFVGADTAGCLLSAGFDRVTGTVLLIDIGTNGEMALTHGGRCTVCSTAAGPAFEGAGIACGMRGAEGAVSHVRFEGGQPVCEVIGGTEARGICGSGLLDAVSSMLSSGMIDETGRMQPDGSSGWTREDGADAFILSGEVFLSQRDIRQLQLAKGAVRAGIELLCEEMGIEPSGIDRVLLAGAFGNYLDPHSACATGLIPPCLEDRIVPVGNAAGDGARMCALDDSEFQRCIAMTASAGFLELASLPQFQDRFIESMSF